MSEFKQRHNIDIQLDTRELNRRVSCDRRIQVLKGIFFASAAFNARREGFAYTAKTTS